jgi:hypothetical protein
MKNTIELKVTTEALARAMFPEGGLDAFNTGVYPGTSIPLRKMTGQEIVTVRGTSAGATVVTQDTWIADRFGALGARQVKRLMEVR